MQNDAIHPVKSLMAIQAGYPFRGTVPKVADGNALALQIRDLLPDGRIAWAQLVRTQVSRADDSQWLQGGDVVFVARGAKNYAVYLEDVPVSAVCSQYFYVLRSRSDRLLPAFLAWQINQAPIQRYLSTNAEGSDQLSIRRTVLENIPITVPPIDRQRLFVALIETAASEKKKLEALIANRQQQLEAFAIEFAKLPKST